MKLGEKSLVLKKSYKKGGEKIMRLVLVLTLVALISGTASALTTDSVLLTVQPLFVLSVNISSATGTFGSIVPLKSSKTICVGQIENDGEIDTKWQKLTETDAGSGADPWALITAGTPGSNEFRLLAISTGTDVDPDFCGAAGTADNSCIDYSDHDVIGVTTTLSDLTEGGAIPGTTHPVAEIRKLWVSIMMPNTVSKGSEQTITLSINAVTP